MIYKSVFAEISFLMKKSRTLLINNRDVIKENSKHIDFKDCYYETNDKEEIEFLDAKCKEKNAKIIKVDRIEHKNTKKAIPGKATDTDFNSRLVEREKEKAAERAKRRHEEFLKKTEEKLNKQEVQPEVQENTPEDIPL